MKPTIEELESRRKSFCSKMNENYPDWDTALFADKVNQYYFTGTMQDGLLIIRRDGSYSYYVRQSYYRAVDESPLKNIFLMKSYRDIAEKDGKKLGKVFIEMEVLPYIFIERLKKYFEISSLQSLDMTIRMLRAVKSEYELYWMKESGKQHDKLLAEIVPGLLKEGMSEPELYGMIYENMIKLGYQGLSRFSAFQTEIPFGQIGFGTSILYPASFDGPSGGLGMCAAVPAVGNPQVKLKKGDLVLVDLGYGVNGYHTDKTQLYMFGAKPSSEIADIQRKCIDTELRTAEMLVAGAVPSEIYNKIINGLDPAMKENFMGYGAHQPKFIGHGIGLTVDEMPVIADKFTMPLENNMTLAIEPKRGMKDVGMIGVEDTFIVTADGGKSITGRPANIIVV